MTNDLITDFMEIIKKECPTIMGLNGDFKFDGMDIGDQLIKAESLMSEFGSACEFLNKLMPMVKVVLDHNERLEAMNKKLSDLLTIEIEKGEVSK